MKERTGAREGDTRGMSPSRAPIFSCAHYFQAPATQATLLINSFKTEGRGLKGTNYILGNNVLLIVSTKMYILNFLGQVFKTFHAFSFLSSSNYQQTKEDCGESGHRSRYLPHAKRALYHLS